MSQCTRAPSARWAIKQGKIPPSFAISPPQQQTHLSSTQSKFEVMQLTAVLVAFLSAALTVRGNAINEPGHVRTDLYDIANYDSDHLSFNPF